MTSPLADQPTLRRAIYTVFWVVGLAIGATQVGYASTDNGTPDWLNIALAVYAFLGGAIGFTAQQNVGNPAQPEGFDA
jgi:hypothetical protein